MSHHQQLPGTPVWGHVQCASQSRLKYIKDEHRNSLDEGHLNACLMLAAQRMWDLHTFPYSRAMGKWAAAKERHLTVHGSKHQQQGRQEQREQPAAVDLDSDAD